MSFQVIATLPDGLRRYQKLVDMNGLYGADFKAKSQAALQFLNWCNEGSPNEPTVPPIKTGNLRGSASVFVGAVLIMNTRQNYGVGTPVTNYDAPVNEMTLVYNTDYAARMHEDTWNPGEGSLQSGNVGNKWVERHMSADGAALLEMYALTLKRLTGA